MQGKGECAVAHRYFTSDIAEDSARISGADASHLARVLRARPGQQLVLCDGMGMDYEAEIESVLPEEVRLRVLSKMPTAAEPSIWVDVFIGLSKGERMEWAVQKAVELGASAISPFFSENTVVKPKEGAKDKKTERLARIAAEAAKQCGRGILPEVKPPMAFSEVLALASQKEQAMFFYEGGGIPLREALKATNNIALITGPEGGFSPAEAVAAREAGCIPVGLGPRILRCETAPAAALAAVMALTGNLE